MDLVLPAISDDYSGNSGTAQQKLHHHDHLLDYAQGPNLRVERKEPIMGTDPWDLDHLESGLLSVQLSKSRKPATDQSSEPR